MINIETYKFDKDVVKELQQTKFGNKWPIVYIIKKFKRPYFTIESLLFIISQV